MEGGQETTEHDFDTTSIMVDVQVKEEATGVNDPFDMVVESTGDADGDGHEREEEEETGNDEQVPEKTAANDDEDADLLPPPSDADQPKPVIVALDRLPEVKASATKKRKRPAAAKKEKSEATKEKAEKEGPRKSARKPRPKKAKKEEEEEWVGPEQDLEGADWNEDEPAKKKLKKNEQPSMKNFMRMRMGKWRKLRYYRQKVSTDKSVQGLLRILWEQEDSKDMVIKAKGNVAIKCHMAVFSAVSRFAGSLLRSAIPFHDGLGPLHLIVPDIPALALAKLVKMMYCVNNDMEDAENPDSEASKISDDLVNLFGLSGAKPRRSPAAKKSVMDILTSPEPVVNIKEEKEDEDVSVAPLVAPIVKDNVILTREENTFIPSNRGILVRLPNGNQIGAYSKFSNSGPNMDAAGGDDVLDSAQDEAPLTALEKNTKDYVVLDYKPKPERLCTLCGKVFYTTSKLKYHMNWHDGLTPYECDECEFKSHSKLLLLIHKRNNHNKTEKCTLCPQMNIKDHMKRHHGPNLPFGCNECQFRASLQKTVTKHMAVHHKDKGYKHDMVQCAKCPAYLPVGSLSKHIRRFHDETRPYPCDECQVFCVTETQLKDHKVKMHSKKPRMACLNDCGATFVNEQYMKWHARRHCPKSTVKEQLIQKEIANGVKARQKEACLRMNEKYARLYDEPAGSGAPEQTERPFACIECDYRACSERGIVMHYNSTHKQKTKTAQNKIVYEDKKCPRCPAVVKANHYDMHQKLHHDPALPFGCDECGYRAMTAGSVKHHKGTYHSKKERIPCQNGCGKWFTDRHYARWHAKRHCEMSLVKGELVQKERDNGRHEKKIEAQKKKNVRLAELSQQILGEVPRIYKYAVAKRAKKQQQQSTVVVSQPSTVVGQQSTVLATEVHF